MDHAESPRDQFGETKQKAGNVSIAYLLELNGKRLLFTGDIEPNVADRIADELKLTSSRP